MPSKIAAQKARLRVVTAELEQINHELNALRGNQTIKCICGKSHKIAEMDLIIPQKWQSNRGYEDGYNYDGDLHAICTHESTLANRLVFETRYDIDYSLRSDPRFNAGMQFKQLYTNLFKSVTRPDECDVTFTRWGNNTYIDDHHKKFEIDINLLTLLRFRV